MRSTRKPTKQNNKEEVLEEIEESFQESPQPTQKDEDNITNMFCCAALGGAISGTSTLI